MDRVTFMNTVYVDMWTLVMCQRWRGRVSPCLESVVKINCRRRTHSKLSIRISRRTRL
jgi:hypothetical protein